MKLNFFERLFILSPIRLFLQNHFEAKRLFAMGGRLEGARVLEVGCGPGFGIEILYRQFGAGLVNAFDLDPEMVLFARRRQEKKSLKSSLWVSNVRNIPVADSQYDAVFNFGAIHHVLDWKAALIEIYRVIKPGGKFFCEEILKHYITHPVIGKLMDHPQKDRFDDAEFIRELNNTGFQINSSRQMAKLYLWVVATKKA